MWVTLLHMLQICALDHVLLCGVTDMVMGSLSPEDMEMLFH